MRTLRPSLAALFALLMLCPGLARGDSFVVGIESGSYYPIFEAGGESATGAAVEILNAFAKDSGHSIIYKSFPIPRLYKTFIAGDVDFKFPDNEKWVSARWADDQARAGVKIIYSDPVITYIDGANVVTTRKGIGLSNLKVLGMPLGFTPLPYKALIADKKILIAENPSFEGLIQQALRGRIDAIYGNVAVVAFRVGKLNLAGALTFDASLPYTKDSYRLSSIKYPEVIADFNNWMSRNLDALAAIKDKYRAEGGF